MATVHAHVRDVFLKLRREWRRRIFFPVGRIFPVPALVGSRGDFNHSELSRALKGAKRGASRVAHQLPLWITTMPGMSGRLYRGMINELCRRVPNAVYLEVGSWKGSTACSALFGNDTFATCVDDWSQFDGPWSEFAENIEKLDRDAGLTQIIHKDFRQVDFAALKPKANIYLYDGPHGTEDHRDGITLALPGLSDCFVLIIDDWNWEGVREGTIQALDQNNLAVEASLTIRTGFLNRFPHKAFENSNWHNGYFFAVVRKPSAS